jgi:hypothetical protein
MRAEVGGGGVARTRARAHGRRAWTMLDDPRERREDLQTNIRCGKSKRKEKTYKPDEIFIAADDVALPLSWEAR